MVVQASISEWLAIILFWPLALRFFAHLAMVQSMVKTFEKLAQDQNKTYK